MGATMKEPQGSWLALVTFCTVTTFTAALGFGLLFATGSLAFAGAQSTQVSDETEPSSPAQSSLKSAESVSPEKSPIHKQVNALASQSWSVSKVKSDGAVPGIFPGIITDSRCGARHSMNSGKTSAECARACVGNGSIYVLVDREVVRALEGDPDLLRRLAGERVEIVGLLEGSTIKVESVAAR